MTNTPVGPTAPIRRAIVPAKELRKARRVLCRITRDKWSVEAAAASEGLSVERYHELWRYMHDHKILTDNAHKGGVSRG